MKLTTAKDRSGRTVYVALSERSESEVLKASGFSWEPATDCFRSQRGVPCPACEAKISRSWFTTSAASAARFVRYADEGAKAALAAAAAEIEAARAEAAAGPKPVVVEHHAAGFFYVALPRGAAFQPFKERGWSFCGDERSLERFPKTAQTPPYRAGLRNVWWTALASAARPFAGNLSPAARAALEGASADLSASRALDDAAAGEAEGRLLAPDGLDYAPFQRAGIRFALRRKATLFADEMGLGKTMQAIGTVNNDDAVRTVLVLAPKSLVPGWRREVEKWAVRPTITLDAAKGLKALDAGGLRAAVESGKTAWVVVSHSEIKLPRYAALLSRDYDAIVIDEAHKLKCLTGSKQRPSGWRGSESSEIAFGDEGIWRRAQRRLLVISGTAVENDVQESWAIFRAANPTAYPDFWAFKKAHLVERVDRWGRSFVCEQPEKLQQALRESCMVRRLKADVLSELAPKVRVIHPIAVSGEAATALGWSAARVAERQEAVARLWADQLLAVATAQTPADVTAAFERTRKALQSSVADFEETAEVRSTLGRLKVPYAIERARQLEAERGKVIIFAHHAATIDAMRAALDPDGTRSIRIDGQTPADERLELVDEFQSNESVRFAFLSMRAAGTGLTLTAAATVLFVEFDWTPGSMAQCEDRAHRIGQKSEVLIEYLAFDGTYDLHQCAILAEKASLANAVLDAPISEETVELVRVEAPKPRDLSEVILPGEEARREREREAQRAKEDARIARRLGGMSEDLPAPTEAQRAAAHEAVRRLAAMDPDHAKEDNGVGFSQADVYVGHALANRGSLSDGEFQLAAKLVRKYQGQLGAETLRAVIGK